MRGAVGNDCSARYRRPGRLPLTFRAKSSKLPQVSVKLGNMAQFPTFLERFARRTIAARLAPLENTDVTYGCHYMTPCIIFKRGLAAADDFLTPTPQPAPPQQVAGDLALPLRCRAASKPWRTGRWSGADSKDGGIVVVGTPRGGNCGPIRSCRCRSRVRRLGAWP